MEGNLIVKDDVEEETMHGESADVLDKARLAELVFGETHAGPRSTDHLGQRFLADLRQGGLRLALFPNVGQQQHPRQPLLAGIKELIDQILLDRILRDNT